MSGLLDHLGVTTKEAAFAISGYSVIIKKITLPLLTEKELAQTIHLEAEQHIPFDVREVNLDFQILGPLKEEPDTMAVLLVAGKKDILETYQQILQTGRIWRSKSPTWPPLPSRMPTKPITPWTGNP